MNLLEYEYEIHGLSGALKSFLDRVFSSTYSKILFNIFSNIKFEEKKREDDLVAATFLDKKIVVNPPVFYSLSKEEQVCYIVHELLHIRINQGDAKLKLLSRTLWRFYNKNKLKNVDVSDIMVGKHGVSKKWINKEETVPYLMNYNVNFKYMKPGSQEEMYNILNKSGVFNLNDSFWHKRLGV